MSLAAVAMMIGGMAIKSMGQKQGRKQEAAMLKYRAALGERAAAITARETEVNIERARKRATALTEDQLANIAQGVLPIGTPLNVVAESVGELEKMVRDVGRRGFAESERLRTQSQIDRIAAKIKKKAGRWEVANTLMAGGTKIGMFGYDMGWGG